MTTPRILSPTIHIASREAAAVRRALEIRLATGELPVAHIVAEPESTDDATMEEPIAA